MPAPRNRRHILIQTAPSREDYTPHPRRIELPPLPAPLNRRRHANSLKESLRDAQARQQDRKSVV